MKGLTLMSLLVWAITVQTETALALGPDGERFIAGIKATTPQRACFSLAAFLTEHVIIQIEPGLGGGKAHVGFCSFDKEGYGFGVAPKLSVLRTWSNPLGVEPNQTYVGAELEVALYVNFNVGVYAHVQGDDDHDWLLSAGIGAGF